MLMLWNRSARRAGKKVNPSPGMRFRPRLESLDDRIVPADFSIAQTGGTLTITGAGSLTIDAPITENTGIFDILGNVSGTGMAVAGGLQYAGVVNIVLKTTGNSAVNYANGNLINLTYNGGAGNDSLNIGSVAADHFFLNLTFNGGAGDDTFLMHNGFNRVVNKLAINGGDGNNTVHLGEEATDRTGLGALAVTNGNGFDTLLAGGESLSVIGAVAINNGPNSNALFGNGSVTQFATTQNLQLGGTTTITNGLGDDDVEFGLGAAGAVNTSGLIISDGLGAATTKFLAANNTVAGNFGLTTKGTNTFLAGGTNFTVGGALALAGASNKVDLLSSNSIHVTGATKIIGGNNSGEVTIGTGGTTGVFLGGLNVANGGSTTFAGLNNTISGNFALTASSLSISGDQTLITGSMTVTGPGVNIGGNSFTVMGSTSMKGGNVALNSSLETLLRGTVAISGGSVTLGSVETRLGASNLAGVGNVTINSDTTIAGNLAVTSLGGAFNSNFLLALTGSLTISGAQSVSLAGDGTSIAGNLTISNMAAGANQVTILGTQVGGTSNVNTGAGNDAISVDASVFRGAVTIAMGDGDDTFNAARSTTDISTVFGASVSVDMGTGTDAVAIGLAGDPFNLCVFGGAVTLTGGLGTDSLDILTALNFFVTPPHETGWESTK